MIISQAATLNRFGCYTVCSCIAVLQPLQIQPKCRLQCMKVQVYRHDKMVSG